MTARRSNGRDPSKVMRLVPPSASPLSATGEHPVQWNRPRARLLVVASGRDGVGRSTLAANLAVALGERGARVVLVDGDLAHADLDLLLGVHPRWDVSHVLSGECTLEEVLMPAARNVRLLPGTAGNPELAELDDYRRELLLRSLGHLDASTDWIVLDTAAGACAQTLAFCRAAHEVLVVCTPELPAFSDAYVLIKQLLGSGASRPPRLVVNLAATPEEAEDTSNRMRVFARRFMQIELDVLGAIPEDAAVPGALRLRESALTAYPNSHAAHAYRELAARLWKPAPDGPQDVVDVEQPHRLEA